MYKDPDFARRKANDSGGIITYSVWESIKKLINNPSYMLIVCGYGAWMFYIGGLSFWGPDYMY
jgi:hypothetical protein